MRATPRRLAVVIPVALATIAAGVVVIALSAHGAGPSCRSAGPAGPSACATMDAAATPGTTVVDSTPASPAPSSAPSASTTASPSARPSSSSPKPAAATAPAGTFPVGRRGSYTFTRAGRTLITRVWYPASGGKAGAVTADAPLAPGRYPLILFSHGWGGVPETYLAEIVPLAAAGFIVAAPEYPTSASGRQTNLQDGVNGNQSLDASEVITRVLAFGSTAGNPFYQHVDGGRGVGAAGHSLGGITTDGLISSKRDSRVTAAIILAGSAIGTPTGSPVKVLFIHGDQDPTVSYAGARAAYTAIGWPKAFLTHLGQGHDSWVWSNGATYRQTRDTMLDWMRWALYGDPAAKQRLTGDASAAGTKWETAKL